MHLLKTMYFIPNVLCGLSAKQMIHMKCQDLFSQKNKDFRMSSAINFAWHFKG